MEGNNSGYSLSGKYFDGKGFCPITSENGINRYLNRASTKVNES